MALSLTYWILAAYLVLGSISLGYLFLRTGWPKVRSLEAPYKIGWSIILGLVFAVFSVAGSLVIDAFFPTGLGSGELLLVIAAASLIATLPMLTLRRKFFAAKKARVHVPKEIVGAKLVATKAVDKLMFDRAFIDSSGLQLGKINELRKVLERKRAEASAAAVAAAAPEKKDEEPKPAVAPAEKQAEAPDWMKDEGKAQEKPAPVVPKPQFLRTAFEQKISEAAKKTRVEPGAQQGAFELRSNSAAEEESKAREDEKKKKDAEAAKISETKAKDETKRAGADIVEKKPELQKKPVEKPKPAVAAAAPAAKAVAEEKKKQEQVPAAKPLKKEGEIEIGWETAGAQKASLGEEEKKKKIQELKETIRKAKEAK